MVISQYEVSPSNPAVVSGRGGGIRYFPNATSNVWNSGAPGVVSRVDSSQVGFTPTATNASGQLTVPPRLNGTQFKVRASGLLVSPVTNTATVQLQAQTSPNLASPIYATIAAADSTANLAAGTYQWAIEASLQGDSTSGQLTGWYGATFNNHIANSGQAAGAGPLDIVGLSNISFSSLGFVIGVTFPAFDPGNSASLYEFKIIQD
jgi:hypothetical protein